MSNIGIPSSSPIGIFEGKSIITSVSFGSECTYIGDNAFKDCVSLKQINDDNMIECIGDNTFKGCVSLKQSNDDGSSVDNNSTEKIPILNFNNLTRLGESAFECCESLENVSMDKCFTISPSAFKDCKSLSHINIPNCTEIGSSAFYDCENLSDIYLDNCTKIESAAFENCLSLSKITLNKCEEIGPHAFYRCEKLSEVHINTPRRPDGLPYCKLVDINAFEGTNKNIQFYIAAEIIDTYRIDSNWSKYVNQMKQLNKDTQIIYMTTDNAIGFDKTAGSDSNSDSDGITSYTISYSGSFGIVEFDNALLSLNDKLFKGLTTLSGVEFPDKCERIGEKEFSGCESLSYVRLPNVKYIDNYAFENCISLTRFTIPNSVCELGDGVFAGCENIKFEGKFATADGNAVVFEYNEPTLDPEIYNKKYKLISVSPKDERRKLDISEIDPKISILGEKCFYGCKNLRRVDIHDEVTDIGNNAFEGCENLYEVYFHGNGMFNSIGENIFENIATDFKIFVPEELLEVYIQSLGKYKDHIYPIPANNCIICYTTNDDAPEVPSELGMILCEPKDGRKYYKTSTGVATNIPNGWFTNNDKITEVILGEDVTSIGYHAFLKCTNLKYIHLSDKIYSFGSYCFKECTALTSIHIPNSLGTNGSAFGDYIFEMCSNLKEFKEYEKKHVSDDRRCCIDGDKIIYFASGDYNANNEYLIPYGIKEIYKGAFRGSNIKYIDLNQTKIIGENAFQSCPLTNINSWEQVNDIQSYAFESSALEEISLPSNLTNIGEYAFCNCRSVYLNGNIPQKVTNIGKGAFKDCTNFKCVNKDGEGMLTLGKITSINNNTFENCTSLTKVKISDSVTQIGINAFSGCGITSVSISINSNLKTISTNAFYNCNSLECLPLPMKLTQIGTNAFRNCNSYVGFSTDDFVTSMPSIGLPKKLTIPISVSSIGTNAFENTGICDVVIPNNSNLTSIPNAAFKDCQELKTISILSTKTTSIGNNAFSGCSNLCKNNSILNLPNNIAFIGDSAFEGCQYISTLPLPSNLKILGHKSFSRGSKATTTLKVTIPTGLSTPPTFQPTLSSTNPEPFDKNNLIIYVPEQYVDTYKTNSHWIKYVNAIRSLSFNGGTNLEFDDGKLDTDFENQVKPFQ